MTSRLRGAGRRSRSRSAAHTMGLGHEEGAMADCFKEATDIIRHCTSELAAYDLEECRDKAREAFDIFSVSRSREDGTNFIGHWTRLVRAMAKAQKFDQRRLAPPPLPSDA